MRLRGADGRGRPRQAGRQGPAAREHPVPCALASGGWPALVEGAAGSVPVAASHLPITLLMPAPVHAALQNVVIDTIGAAQNQHHQGQCAAVLGGRLAGQVKLLRAASSLLTVKRVRCRRQHLPSAAHALHRPVLDRRCSRFVRARSAPCTFRACCPPARRRINLNHQPHCPRNNHDDLPVLLGQVLLGGDLCSGQPDLLNCLHRADRRIFFVWPVR